MESILKNKMTKDEMNQTNHKIERDFAILENGDQYLWDDRFEHWAMWKREACQYNVIFTTRSGATLTYKENGTFAFKSGSGDKAFSLKEAQSLIARLSKQILFSKTDLTFERRG